MISIFIASRKSGNLNSNLVQLLQDIENKTKKLNQIEILIRVDKDDENYFDEVQMFGKKLSYTIKVLQGEQLEGYTSLHDFYSELIPLANPGSEIYMCFADDFRVQKDWDLMVHKILRKSSKSKFFIVHQKPHPPTNRPFANIFKFNQLPREEKFEELIGVDEAPGWSSNLIKELGNFGPVAATDSWTLSLERRLQERKLNITYFTKKPIIKRVFNEDIDSPKAERWHTQRKHIFSKISSNSFEQEVSHSVEAINTFLSDSHFKNFVANFRYFYYLKLLESIKTKIVLRNLAFFKYIFAESIGAASPIVLFQIKHNNLVCYQNYFYLIPHSLGKIDFNHSETIEKLKRSRFLPRLILESVLFQE